jgi:hypothetical protein
MFLLTNKIIIHIFSLRTLYCKMIKTFVFFIKNWNWLFDLSRWRVHIHEWFACEFKLIHQITMHCFFHVFRIHNRIIRSRVFVARTCHIVFWFDSSRNRWKFEKNVWFQTFIFFLLILIIFHFEKTIFEFVIEIVNNVDDELITNQNTLKTICDPLTRYNRIRVCRTCSVFCFFFQHILHFDDHAMCSRFSHVSHIFSMIDESHSSMWYFMTHFSHTTTIRQCFFICSYFW